MNYHGGPGIQSTFMPPEKSGYYSASAAFPPGYPAVGLSQRGAHQPGAGMNGMSRHPPAAYRQAASSYGLPVPYSSVTSYPALSSAAYGAALQGSMGSHPVGYQTIAQPGVIQSRGPVGISQASAVPYQVSQSTNYTQPTYLSNQDPQLYSQQMGVSMPTSMSVPSTMGMPVPTQMSPPSSMGMAMPTQMSPTCSMGMSLPSTPSGMSMPSSMGMPMQTQMSVPSASSMGMPTAMYAATSPYPSSYSVQPPHPSYSSIGYSGLPASRGVNPSFPSGMGYPTYQYK